MSVTCGHCGTEIYSGDANANYEPYLERYERKCRHILTEQRKALIAERDALRDLWERWLTIYAEEHDESCTPENCSMAALVADVRAHFVSPVRPAVQPNEPHDSKTTLKHRLDLFEWALRGNTCWLGTTLVDDGSRAEFIAVYQPRPYAAPETVPTSQDTDPYHCIWKAKQWFESDYPTVQTTEGQGK